MALAAITWLCFQCSANHTNIMVAICSVTPCPSNGDSQAGAVTPFSGSGMTCRMDLRCSNVTGVLLPNPWSVQQPVLSMVSALRGFLPVCPMFYAYITLGSDLLYEYFSPRPKTLRSCINGTVRLNSDAVAYRQGVRSGQLSNPGYRDIHHVLDRIY